jgi:hypothetical protein
MKCKVAFPFQYLRRVLSNLQFIASVFQQCFPSILTPALIFHFFKDYQQILSKLNLLSQNYAIIHMDLTKDVTDGAASAFGFSGGAHRIRRNEVKVRRTYGWDCPCKDYKSRKWYNTPRHINSIHGIGSGEPVDSRTGETREEKKNNAIRLGNMPKGITGSLNPPGASAPSITLKQSDERFERKEITWGQPYPTSIELEGGQNYGDTLVRQASGIPCRMPFLEAQEKRLKELGYNAQTLSWHHYAVPPNRPTSGFPLNQQDRHDALDVYQNQYTNSVDHSQNAGVPLDWRTADMHTMLELMRVLREK